MAGGVTVDLPAVAREAAARWRQDRALLLPVAGLLLFVPQWAVLLCIPNPPVFPGEPGDTAAMTAWAPIAQAWARSYGLGYLAAFLVGYWGRLALIALYLGGGARPTVGGALAQAGRRLVRFILAELLVWLPIAGAFLAGSAAPPLLFVVVPATVWVLGRTLLIGPAVLTGRGGAAGAIVRSWRWTRGHGGVLALLAGALLIGAPVVVELVRQGGDALAAAHLATPVVIAAIDGVAAAIDAAAMLALAMSVAVLHRRLAR